MNKEEILAKSRNENKGRTDEMETAVLGKAGRIAAAAGGLVCMLIVILNLISMRFYQAIMSRSEGENAV